MQELSETRMPWLKGKVVPMEFGPLGQLFNVPFNTDWRPGQCLFFGRIEAYKNLPHFIAAVRILRKSGRNVIGVIAGRGTELNTFKEELAADDGFVIKEGYLTPAEVVGVFRHANVVVMPYLDATQSGVAAYALGMARPVISTRVGSVQQLVRDGETGFLVPPNDLPALVAALGRLLDKRELAAQFAHNAHHLANGAHSWVHIARRTKAVYKKLISQSRRNRSDKHATISD
jgi:glycosyltransferase involved in cell wall biosynthesis